MLRILIIFILGLSCANAADWEDAKTTRHDSGAADTETTSRYKPISKDGSVGIYQESTTRVTGGHDKGFSSPTPDSTRGSHKDSTTAVGVRKNF